MAGGQFKKGNTAAKGKGKRNKSTYIYSNDAHNVKLPEERRVTQTNPYDYVEFGTNNLFPQETYELYKKSAVLSSVVNSKRNYVIGDGFSSENKAFENWTANPNESLRGITDKLELDRINTGNCYFEIVVKNNEVNFYHKDATTIRLHKDGVNAIIHPDWGNYNAYKKYAKVIPLYPEFIDMDGAKRSIYHIKDYVATFNYYGIPSNIGGMDSANINYKTNKWNLSRLENAFKLSGILMIEADFSKEDAQQFDGDFDSKFTGQGNQGKVLKIVNEIGGDPNSSKFIPITTSEEGDWTQLHTQATNEIIVANQWYASLAGLPIASGFDSNRIRNDHSIAMTTIIPYERQFFLEAYTKVLNDLMNMNLEDLAFVSKTPLNNIDLIDFTDTVGKNERRAYMGLGAVEEEDVKQSLNGAQVTSMVDVIRAFKAGEISESAGVQILITGFGLTEDAAKLFFK